jgi:cyclophilin family peptidyl-prolyl cis-trans isomerase/HEAT repeat protein
LIYALLFIIHHSSFIIVYSIKLLTNNQLNMNRIKAIFCICIAFTMTRCVPPEYGKVQYSGINIDFRNPTVQLLYTLQDRQNVDSLARYFRDRNPTYRYISAMAFASIKDKKVVDSLIVMLKDTMADVRLAAAYALGQIEDKKAEPALMASFRPLDTLGQKARFNATVLEAIGKCGSAKNLSLLTGIKTFKIRDTILLEGQALGIYRYGLRDTFTGESIRKMIGFLQEPRYPATVRAIAANYLGRLKTKYDTAYTNPMVKIFPTEKDPNVRMGLAKALGKAYQPSMVNTLETYLQGETDFRVTCNLLSALSDFPYTAVHPIILAHLKDKNPQIAATAAEYLVAHGDDKDGMLYQKLATEAAAGTPVRYVLYAAAVRYSSGFAKLRDSLNSDLKNEYKSNPNPYQKAACVRALAQAAWNFDFLRTEALNPASPPIVKVTAAQGLMAIANRTDFNALFQNDAGRIRQELKATFFDLLRTADAGLVAEVSKILRNPMIYDRKSMADSVGILTDAMKRLKKLPQDLEAHQEIAQSINYIRDSVFVAKKKLPYTRSIDWNIVNMSLNSVATVMTTKGEIKMQFMGRNAPATVANFVKLSKSGFFNGKTFHRVVPNFVVQTGCPRGDGYGGLDFSIRSELTPLHYETEGYVGMASAGAHTESSQWFITQSPAMHLDPNYTIFAKVISGMNVVYSLGVGDAIQTVTIQ